MRNTLTINLEELYLGYQTSDSPQNTLSLLSVTFHCMLLDLVFTSRTHKPLVLTDQESQTKSSQKDKSTPSIIETTGNNVNYILWLFHTVYTIRVKR